MIALLALLLSQSIEPQSRFGADPRIAFVASGEAMELRASLRKRLEALDAQKHGVFHEDVTPIVASLFPVGQPFRETQQLIETQHLGALKPFKGEPHEGTTMYVTHFTLVPDMPGNVYVVIDFDFDGKAEADMRLKTVKAYLRASNM